MRIETGKRFSISLGLVFPPRPLLANSSNATPLPWVFSAFLELCKRILETMPSSSASSSRKKRGAAKTSARNSARGGWISLWPLLLGIAVTPFTVRLASILALEGPKAFALLYPWVVVLRCRALHLAGRPRRPILGVDALPAVPHLRPVDDCRLPGESSSPRCHHRTYCALHWHRRHRPFGVSRTVSPIATPEMHDAISTATHSVTFEGTVHPTHRAPCPILSLALNPTVPSSCC